MPESVARDDCAIEMRLLKTREPNTAAPRAFGGVIPGLRPLTHDVVAFDVELDARL